MKFYQLLFYIGDDYETMEILIDEEQKYKIEGALAEGKQFLQVKDQLIKSSLIKGIFPANHIVEEYLKMGVPLKQLGLREPDKISAPKTKQEIEGRERYEDMKSRSNFGKLT